MEVEAYRTLEALMAEKEARLSELLGCFEDERRSLLQTDLDALWDVSRRKEAVAEAISALNRKIRSTLPPPEKEAALESAEIGEQVPALYRPRFQELHQNLKKLERDAAQRRRENKLIIDESIELLDDMIAILAGKSVGRGIYGQNRRMRHSETPLLMSRET